MASRDVTLKVGDTLRVILDHNGPVREVELKLSAEGITIGQNFGAPPVAPKAPTGKLKKPEAVVESVELEEEPPPPPKAKSAPKVAPAKPAPRTATKPPSKPIIDEPVETVEAVDIPMDDLMGGASEPDQQEESAEEVRDEVSGDISDSDFNLDGESAPAEEVEGTDAVVSESDSAPTDDSLVDDAPPEEAPADIEADPSMRLTGVPGVASHREAADSATSEEELLDGGGALDELDAEFNQTQAPFDADARTMPPAPRAGSAPSLQAEEPEIDALSLEEEPVSSAPPPKPAQPARAGGRPAPGAKPPDSGELPAWTGRARDYKDPVIETRKAETRKIQKGAPGKPAPAFNQDVNLGEEVAEEAPAVDIPSEDGGEAPSVDIPLEDGGVEAVDIPLDLEEEPAKPVVKGKPPAPKLPPKPPNKLAKAPTAPIKAPTGPIRPPVSTKAPAAPAKPVPTATKPASNTKPPGADGAFTVFLSPPKGADKKQTAAEIIAEINGIDIDAAMELAGKMIVPVAKGVSESEANRVKDKFKEAGLSCRITQKR
ncbi:MAG: hypothetical protein IT462_08040 [Planctomycetes bacterium]|nr:hypothetical protein [Planctomycetota bacterium]